MTKLMNGLVPYLEEIIGEAPRLGGMPQVEARKAPLFLRSAYRLFTVHLFGRSFALAVEDEEREAVTPSEHAKRIEALRAAFGTDVALVLATAPTHVRNRLVQRGVPFIVPGRQLFLPFLAVDLREREPRVVRATRQVVSAAAQVVVLRHLLGEPVERHTLAELAAETGYSPMTMTNVGKELTALGLCEVVRDGRAQCIVFGESGQHLWERALPHLADPVRARRWVRRWKPRKSERLAAGLSALARFTDLADDEIPSFALAHKEYRARIESGDIVECSEPDEATAALECWTYAPTKLSRGDCVDRLSLYLSLRNAADERVQKGLGTLLKGVPW